MKGSQWWESESNRRKRKTLQMEATEFESYKGFGCEGINGQPGLVVVIIMIKVIHV